jgi:1-pyrroline-5-carboxylate dehydrogenase
VPRSDLEITDFKVINEPILGYLAGSKERQELEAALGRYSAQCEDIPIVIGGKEYRTENVQYQVMPHDHQKKVAKFYWATPELVKLGIDSAMAAKKEWEAVPINDKIQMFLKVSDLMADQYRSEAVALVSIAQS